MTRRGLALVAAFALAGCTTTLSPSASFMARGAGPVGDFNVPLASVEDRRFAGVVRQRFDFSCGSAALATLLRYHYGALVDERAAFLGMWKDGDRDQIRKVGFSLLDMKRYLEANGLQADGYKVPLDKVAETGIPGIALISIRNYRHFVVVKGVRPTEVLVGDPSRGLQAMPRDEFEAAWNGVYFVLNSDQAIGRSAFNRDVQWAQYARAPIGGDFADPVSLQALSLTAPFYRDF